MHKKVQRIKLIIQTSQEVERIIDDKRHSFTVLNAYFLFDKLVRNVLFIYCATNLPRVTLPHVLQAIGSDINSSWKVSIVNKSF